MDIPYGTSIFCDDIRYEVGGKVSLVGCYGAEKVLNDPAPIILPTFAIFIKIIFPRDYQFERIVVRVFSNFDDTEEEIAMTNFVPPKGVNKISRPDGKTWEHMVGQFILPLQWTSFHIPSNGVIFVRAYFENGAESKEIRLGALPCRFASPVHEEV